MATPFPNESECLEPCLLASTAAPTTATVTTTFTIAEDNQQNSLKERLSQYYQKNPKRTLFWFIALLLVIFAVQVGLLVFAFRNEPPPVRCGSRILPGAEILSRGVDITTIDLFPTSIESQHGFLHPVIKFTCNHNQRWTFKKTTYIKPDQLASVNAGSGGMSDSTVRFTRNSDEYTRSLSVDAKLNVDTIFYGEYSASFGLKNIHQNSFRRDQATTETSATISIYDIQFHLGSLLKPSEDLVHFVNSRLTEPFEAKPNDYLEFVRTFGTHFFGTGKFGGRIGMRTTITNEYMSKHDELEVSANLTASFSVVKADISSQYKQSRVSDDFEHNSQKFFYFYGGGPVKISPKDPAGYLQEWQPKVEGNPWLIGGKLLPIEDLLSFSPIAKEGVRKAVLVHLTQAYYRELLDLIKLSDHHFNESEGAKIKEIGTKLMSSTEVMVLNKRVHQFVANIEVTKAREEHESVAIYLRYLKEAVERELKYFLPDSPIAGAMNRTIAKIKRLLDEFSAATEVSHLNDAVAKGQQFIRSTKIRYDTESLYGTDQYYMAQIYRWGVYDAYMTSDELEPLYAEWRPFVVPSFPWFSSVTAK